METVFRLLARYNKRSIQVNEAVRPNVYKHPVFPRLVLEVNQRESICIAAATPNFIVNGSLFVPDFCAHVRTRMRSENFKGFVITCLTDSEDMVGRLNMFPHVLEGRLFIYKPTNQILMELCALLSMLENFSCPSREAVMSIVHRARILYNKCPTPDATFILQGVETIAATTIYYHDLDPTKTENLCQPLLHYKLKKELDYVEEESRGLLKAIYLDSNKIDRRVPYVNDKSTLEKQHTFNLLYSDTVFTRLSLIHI